MGFLALFEQKFDNLFSQLSKSKRHFAPLGCFGAPACTCGNRATRVLWCAWLHVRESHRSRVKIVHMTACDATDFPYEKPGAPSSEKLRACWDVAIGLQQTDIPSLLRNMAPLQNEG